MSVTTDIKPNAEQQECIDNINGKFLVLAGPGTGKTFTIVQRIKSMVEGGIEPHKILCLTFSDAAANEMKTRLEKELNQIDTGVNIYTYHSFCNKVINENVTEFELPNNYRVISDAISYKFFKECIDELNPVAYRTKRNDPYYFLGDISNQIAEIKKNRLTKEQYFKNIETNPDWQPELTALKIELKEKTEKGEHITQKLTGGIEKLEKKIAKAKETWEFYEKYKSKMEEEHYVDFDDMISMVLDKFENEPVFLDKIANEYEYILVDEYQDTNKSQNEIVFNLTQGLKSENVFVVGDDDQIIFTFQGAKLDTIEKFLKKFPDTEVICLKENMRSTQNILNVAREVAKQDERRLEINPEFKQYKIDKDLIAKNQDVIEKDKKVRCCRYADVLQEYNSIVEEIEILVNSDDCPKDDDGNKKLSEIAILTKSHAELATFSELLQDKNIPYELKDGKNAFEIKSSTVLYYYMKLLVNPELNIDKFFKLILSPPFNINSKDYETLYEKRSIFKSFEEIINSFNSADFVEPEKIKNFIDTYRHLQQYKTNETLKNIILEIGAKTGIVDYYVNSELNRNENISGLIKIIDEATEFYKLLKKITLEDYVEYLDMVLAEDIVIKADKASVTLNAIQLSTYHSAKGREFEYVYMPTLVKESWEGDRSSYKPVIPINSTERKTEDEYSLMKRSDKIKLMFVGMTRAKHTLRLSYPQLINGKPVNPSEFIANIFDMFEIKEALDYDVNSFWHERTKLLLKRDYDYKRDFGNMIKAILQDRYYSPTAVNTYLNCPRQYFYDTILGLPAKDGNPDALSYGSAVHRACEFAVKFAIEKGAYPNKEEFIKAFEDKLNEEPMSTLEQRYIHIERGRTALDKYYTQLCLTPVENLISAEYYFKFEEDVKFKGIIDRIDKNSDGTYTIYDYKTGSAKSLSDISLGGNKENYYMQMGLYKYYYEKSTGNTVKDTVFIFPEDYTKNLSVTYTQNECNEVVERFKTAIKDINASKFEPSYDKNACQYCQYKDFCNLNVI